MKGIIFFEDGMEDSEGVTSRALIRRTGIQIDVVTTNPKKIIKTGYGLNIEVEKHISEVNIEGYDFIIIPGGPYIARIYDANTPIHETIKYFYNEKKLIGAICAAPRILGFMGLLKGLDFTCYPGCEVDAVGGNYQPFSKAVVAKNIITGKSPAYIINFIYEVIKKLVGKERADALLTHLAYTNGI